MSKRRFITELDTHQISDSEVSLDTDLVFFDTDVYWIAPAGTTSDLASIPVALFNTKIKTGRAGVLHDAAYRARLLRCGPDKYWAYKSGVWTPPLAKITRAEADALLYRALIATGFSRPRAAAWWVGVRTLALLAWRRGQAKLQL